MYLAINYLLRGKDIAYCINHSESKLFIVEDALYDLVKDVLDEMPTVKTWIWSTQGAGKPPVSDKFKDFEPWYKAYPATEPDTVLRIEDPVQMTYTSGTESLPKGVIITNQALIAEYMGCIIDGGYDEDDIKVNALPIYHCAQRDVFLNPIFWVGGTNILMAPDIGKILKTIADYKATMFFAPPTVWIGLLRHPDFAQVRSHEPEEMLLRGIHHARGDPQGDHGEIPGIGNLQLLRPDGACALSHDPQGEGRPAQAGLRRHGRPEHGNPARRRQLQSRLQAGVPGEICGKGPHALIMYFKEPEKTEEAMKGGWFHSGDIGVMDEDRYITVVDRKKDMIKTGGENVPTREVEDAIYKDPRVQEVAVIGIPHPKWVEAVTAIIVPKAGQTIPEKEIIELCRKELAGFKVPKGIVFVQALPKTPTGKILKRDMRVTYKGMFDKDK